MRSILCGCLFFVSASTKGDETLQEGASVQDLPVGLVINEHEAYKGNLLISPMNGQTSYLIGSDGELLRSWSTRNRPGMCAYLLEDGSLMRAGSAKAGGRSPFRTAGGTGGVLERYDRDGSLDWRFELFGSDHMQHHDFCVMPNGNLLAIVWARVGADEALSRGRNPNYIYGDSLFYLRVVEIAPRGSDEAQEVWVWNSWDHLIQDYSPEYPNFGVISEYPNRIDVNYHRTAKKNGGNSRHRMPRTSTGEIASLRTNIGEVDWMHANSIDYNPKTGYILVSVHGFDEVWVIDRNNPEKGLIYRMGNPVAYGAGGPEDQTFFRQHDANWIDEGLPGEGNILLFNNGLRKAVGEGSRVMEFSVPWDAQSELGDGNGFVEAELVWAYDGFREGKPPFFARRMSGAQRLPNGNTLVCHGPKGRVFQVTPEGEVVWEYWNEYGRFGPESDSPRHADSTMPIFKARMYPKSYGVSE